VFSGNSIGPKNRRGLSQRQILAYEKLIRKEKREYTVKLNKELKQIKPYIIEKGSFN
jgi:hypothetical protein